MKARIPTHQILARFTPVTDNAHRWPGSLDARKARSAALRDAVKLLAPFIGRDQFMTIRDAARGEEGDWFIAKLIELAAHIRTMPHSYQTDGQGDAALAQLHYFTGSCDWFITEKDMGAPDDEDDSQQQAFGLARIHEEELGYISIEELIGCGAELDLHWKVKPITECREGYVKPPRLDSNAA